MAEPSITYVPLDTATPQGEISALVDAYEFLRNSRNGQEGSPVMATLDDTRGDTKRDSRAKRIVPERL